MRARILLVSLLFAAACGPSPAASGDTSGDPGAGGSGQASGGVGGEPGQGGHAPGGQGGQGGQGGSEPPADVCDPYAPRAPAPELLVGPKGLEGPILGLIEGAKKTVDVTMYQLDRKSFVGALVAAHGRGVRVRVILDETQSVNVGARAELESAGIEVKGGSAEFKHDHAKVLLFDGEAAVVMSANLNGYSMSSERNYGIVDRDPADVSDLVAIFERDWAGEGELDLSCTRLVVSPVNARARIAAHIEGAKESLDLAVMYVSDDGIRAALKARAKAGVPVRVLLASPDWIDANEATAAELKAAGVQTRYLKSYELHAKLVVADGVPFVGSENLSYTSLEKNREVGLFVTEAEPAAAVVAHFEADWKAGVSAP